MGIDSTTFGEFDTTIVIDSNPVYIYPTKYYKFVDGQYIEVVPEELFPPVSIPSIWPFYPPSYTWTGTTLETTEDKRLDETNQKLDKIIELLEKLTKEK